MSFLLAIMWGGGQDGWAIPPTPRMNQLSVPILGVTLNKEKHQIGIVTQVVITFQERNDHNGLSVQFGNAPGNFSPFAQQAVNTAIHRASQAAHIPDDSWSVFLSFPYSGKTMYGESLSAMVGLSVVALAKGDPLINGRSITGTITQEGNIGKVGGVPLKIHAAFREHMERVLIPEEFEIADGDWQTPFLMQISPVGNVNKAYHALTGQPLTPVSPIHTTAPSF